MSKLQPISNLVNNQGINVNPMAQKGLLKYALNKTNANDGNDSVDSDEGDYSKFGSRK